MDEMPWSSPVKSSPTCEFMPDGKHVLLVAGDPSGDEHGAALAHSLKELDPTITISALGGTHLRRAAGRFIFPLVGVGGFGFWEPLAKLPQLWKAWRAVKRLLAEGAPRVIVPIDYYGFNIHVARLAHARGCPVAYYISPQVWASRPGRIQELAKVVSKMLVIFPFEMDLYRQAGIPVEFVGHPLVDRIPSTGNINESLLIGLLPGSRRDIVARHLPIMIDTARELRKTFAQEEFLLFRPAELEASFYQPFLAGAPWVRLVHDPEYQERRRLRLAITVSGTAALENTLLGIPMVVMYKLSVFSYAIARRLIRIPFVAIPNILAGKALVPELLQADATPQKLAAAARALIENEGPCCRMREELLALRARLGAPGGSRRAALEIHKLLL